MVTQALTLNRPILNVGNERSYDVWGGVRSGAATGGPKGRYCANLGHVQDDESGLIYMRARYYEPSAGRFISEDPARDGANWYIYAESSPVMLADPDGYAAWTVAHMFKLMAIGAVSAAALNVGGQLLLYGNIKVHLIVSAAAWGAIAGGLGKVIAKMKGSDADSLISALLQKDRAGIGGHAMAQVAAASGRTVYNRSNYPEDRQLARPLGKVLDAHLGNAILIRALSELMGWDD